MGIDWMRFVLPRCDLEAATNKLEELFGRAEQGKGLYGLGHGRHFSGGCRLAYDPNPTDPTCAPHAVLEMPGSFLAVMSHEDRIGLLTWAMLGQEWRCTRLDLCIDIQSEVGGLTTIGDMEAATMRGELVGARTFRADHEFASDQGVIVQTREQFNIGRRGKLGSGRYLRAYDKGLETGQTKQGHWVRLEAEFSKDVAHKVACSLLEASDDAEAIRAFVLGVADFLAEPGKRKRDRKRAAWWSAIVDRTQTMRHRQDRIPSDVHGYATWIGRCVAPGLKTYADALSMSLEDFIILLCGHVINKPEKLDTPIGWQITRWWASVRPPRPGGILG